VSEALRRWLRSPARIGLVLACLCAALCAMHRAGRGIAFLERLERATLDLRFRWRGPVAPGDAAVIVALDDRTLAEAPELIERREGAARLIAAVAGHGPAAIGIDAFYTDEERLLAPDLVADIRTYLTDRPGEDPATALLRRVEAETGGDAKLVDAIAAAGKVVLAMHLANDRDPLPKDPALARGRYGQEVIGAHRPAAASTGVLSLPRFNAAARALGVVTIYEDDDHTVREMLFARRVDDAVYMPFVVPLLALQQGISPAETAYVSDARRVQIGGLRVPLTAWDSLLLNFRGPAGSFPQVSAADVIAGRVDPALLRGKIALIGVTYFGHDTTRTPFGAGVPGVELHATAIDTVLAGDALVRASALVETLGCLLSGLLVALVFVARLRLGAVARIAGVLAVAAADVGLAWGLFLGAHRWHGVVWPLICVALVGSVGLAMAYVGEAVQRVRLRRTFAHYLGAEVLEELLADPHLMDLGGARRELTVLFSDIRDFTGLSERLTPEELVALLNVYLTPMTEEVLVRGGYLDKYIGDAVMAVYGAPVPKVDHAARALATATAMRVALAKLEPTLQARGIELRIGVGINTGDMVVGNMGSRERFDYTVVGDAVNLASRLEGLTKVYGVFCIVGPHTRAAAPAYRFRELDLVRVKGKGQPVAIHELLGGPDGDVAAYHELGRWDAVLAAFRGGDLDVARRELAGFAAANPGDPVAAIYEQRLAALGDVVPPGWDGVMIFNSK
jgi:adenylate cyclase